MAKYDVTYSCGHKGEVQLFGKSSERESKIKWYERSATCPECFKAEKKAEGPVFQAVANREKKAAEISCVSESFGIKDTLKERGYKFCEVWYNDHEVKGWTKTIPGDPEHRAEFLAEVQWIKAQGYKYEADAYLSRVQ